MNRQRIEAIGRRQQVLLMRSAMLRASFVDDAAALRPPLAAADRVRDGWRWLRARPQIPIAAVVVTAVLRPRRVWRWGLRLWSGWALVRRLSRHLPVF